MEIENQVTPPEAVFESRPFANAEPEPGQELTPEAADALIAQGQEGAEAPVEGQEAPEPEEEKIRIGGKVFNNSKEAFEYAQELEQEKIAADAFRQGVEAASGHEKGNPPVEPPPDTFDQDFFTDPKKYLKEYGEKIASQVRSQIDTDSARKTKHDQVWADFYKEYPDLESAKKLVNMTLTENWSTLEHVETKKALKIVAEKAREERNNMVKDLLPGKELPSVRNTTSPGSGKTVTTKPAPEKELSFVQQMQKLNKRKASPSVKR